MEEPFGFRITAALIASRRPPLSDDWIKHGTACDAVQSSVKRYGFALGQAGNAIRDEAGRRLCAVNVPQVAQPNRQILGWLVLRILEQTFEQRLQDPLLPLLLCGQSGIVDDVIACDLLQNKNFVCLIFRSE